MKKLNNSLLCTAIVLVAVLLVSGCTQSNNPSNSTTTVSGSTVATTVAATGTLDSMSAKASAITSLQFDTTIDTSTIGGGQDSSTHAFMRTWFKSKYMKIESTVSGITTKIIVRPGMVYLYDNTQKKYVGTPYEGYGDKNINITITDTAKGMENLNANAVGTEVIDGKQATVYEYASTGIPIKVWLWNENGLPLKTEMSIKIGEATTTVTTTYTNFSFADIPDSEFAVE